MFVFLSIFVIHNVYADPIYQNITEGCDDTVLNTVNNVANLIPAFSPTVYTCSSGQFLPADTTECKSCPSGYTCAGGDMMFNENDVNGIDYRSPITSSTQYTCSDNFLHANDNNVANLIPVFSQAVYTCSSGQFLPADTTECKSCPSGYTCAGGDMMFNENDVNGIDYRSPITSSTQYTCSKNFLRVNSNNVSNLIPIFEPNQYTCNTGYYLPANAISCVACTANHYCSGGTYTFNETTDNGIEACPSATPYAPAGSAVCFSSILHLDDTQQNDIIYLKSTSTTSPSLNIDIDDDGVNDGFANMTTTRTPMSNVSNHYLKITVNGVLYYVCDDTSCPGTN